MGPGTHTEAQLSGIATVVSFTFLMRGWGEKKWEMSFSAGTP